MINATDIRAITDAARNKHLIEAIEEAIKQKAYSGENYVPVNVLASRELTMSIVEYFKNAGFVVDYETAGIDPISGVTIYTLKVWW